MDGISLMSNSLNPSLVFPPSLPVWLLTCPLFGALNPRLLLAGRHEAAGATGE